LWAIFTGLRSLLTAAVANADSLACSQIKTRDG
jgi:hypothetical protein